MFFGPGSGVLLEFFGVQELREAFAGYDSFDNVGGNLTEHCKRELEKHEEGDGREDYILGKMRGIPPHGSCSVL